MAQRRSGDGGEETFTRDTGTEESKRYVSAPGPPHRHKSGKPMRGRRYRTRTPRPGLACVRRRGEKRKTVRGHGVEIGRPRVLHTRPIRFSIRSDYSQSSSCPDRCVFNSYRETVGERHEIFPARGQSVCNLAE